MEKNELFSLCFTALWDKLKYRYYCNRSIEIDVELPNGSVFSFTAYVCANHIYDDYEITQCNICKAYFQHKDFETYLNQEYVTELENFILS